MGTTPNWHETDNPTQKDQLLSLCAQYLTATGANDRPLDAVARFHLRNGARLERINWMGDRSEKGLAESHGLLVNYVYDLNTVTRNHEQFVYEHVVTSSSAIKSLAKRGVT